MDSAQRGFQDYGEAEMYEAVLNADQTYDGRFFTGVVTTGIFCFPSCTCRKPRRENIRFFASREQAQQAGFRPCKRCCSELEGGRSGYEAALVEQAKSLVQTEGAALTVAALAAAVSLSPPHLLRLFRRVTGTTVCAYLRQERALRTAELLAAGTPIQEIAPAVGFESTSGLYSAFQRAVGISLGQYRQSLQKES